MYKVKIRRLDYLTKQHTQSGQAVVEYILLMFVMVAIILGLKNSFKSMQTFVSSYVGDYTICLMEYGELPSLGIDNEDLSKHKDGETSCNVQFEKFTLASGRPPVQSSSSNTSSSSPDGSLSSKVKQSSQKKQNSSNSSGENEGSSSSRGRKLSDGRSMASNSRTKIIETEEEEESESGYGESNQSRRSSSSNNYMYTPPYRAITGEYAERILKQNQSRAPSSRSSEPRLVMKNEETLRPGPRKSLIKPPDKRDIASQEDKEEPWSLGSLLKWLIIIALIIVILMFVAGQVFNYNNSEQ